MKKLLFFIGSYLDWLFSEYGFRITNSSYFDAFGGQGWIGMENGDLRIFILSDRERVDIELAPLQGWPEAETVSLDIIYVMLTGEICDSFESDEETVSFLRDFFPRIVAIFSESRPKELKAEVANLKRARAKRLFG